MIEEAKLVGLGGFDPPTLEDVERRRLQLWVLSILVLLGTAGGAVLASVGIGSLGPAGVRLALFALATAFILYTVEKEAHLRRLTRLLVDERVLRAALSNRLGEATALLDAGKAVNSVLELDAVLDIIVNSAISLLDGASGSVMLSDKGGEALRTVSSRGNDAAIGAVVRTDEGIAGGVARSWEPVIVNGDLGERQVPVTSAMCVPLMHRGEFLGVLNVNGRDERVYSEFDLRALTMFADHAAAAIANGRLYAHERARTSRIVTEDLQKSEFLGRVSQDLRTPMTAVLGSAKLLQRATLPEDKRIELASMIDRQGRRVSRMMDELISASRIEGEAPPPLDAVDVAAVCRGIVSEYAGSGRSVAYEGPSEPVGALGTVDGVRRILANLIDNSLRHGAPPVLVGVHDLGATGMIEITVADRGVGIPAGERTHVLERFVRLGLGDDPHHPGIGLGLSIVTGLVARAGGSLRIEDPPDANPGCVIRVHLRAAWLG